MSLAAAIFLVLVRRSMAFLVPLLVAWFAPEALRFDGVLSLLLFAGAVAVSWWLAMRLLRWLGLPQQLLFSAEPWVLLLRAVVELAVPAGCYVLAARYVPGVVADGLWPAILLGAVNVTTLFARARLFGATKPTRHDVCTVGQGENVLLAIAGADGLVRLWEPRSGTSKPTAVVRGHRGPVWTVCALPAGGTYCLPPQGTTG